MYNSSPELMELRPIVPPTHCPSCGSELELVNSQLFCRGDSCAAQSIKKFEHFAKTMKIKGLGPKTLEKLIDNEILVEIYDIYCCEYDDLLSEVLGTKISEKLIQEIEASKTPTLSMFISAFSIPLIGSTAAKKLESVCSSIQDICELTKEKCKKAGLGDVATTNLLNWIEDYFVDRADIFSEYITIKSDSSPKTKTNLGIVVITGKFDRPRAEIQSELEALGFEVKSTVSSKTNYLLCAAEDSTSSKAQKAASLGIKLAKTIDELKAFAE